MKRQSGVPALCGRHWRPGAYGGLRAPGRAGLKVITGSEKVLATRKTLLELMMADHPSPCARQKNSGDCELERWLLPLE